jgi:hypothetical protein
VDGACRSAGRERAIASLERSVARYAHTEALGRLDLAVASARTPDQAQAVDLLTADLVESAGWSETPQASVALPVTREIVSEDLDLRVRGSAS